MEDHRDIYKKPEQKSAEQERRPAYESTPADYRGKLWRRATVLALLIIVLLGLAAITLHERDAQKKREQQASVGAGPEGTNAAAVRAPLSPSLIAPDITDYSDITEPSMVSTLADIAPKKMLEALAEIRIASQYFQAKDWESSETHAQKALEIAPNFNAGLRMLGLVYTQRGQFDQAIVVLDKAMKQDPFNPETYNNLASAYMQKRMMNKAEELLSTSLQIRPGFPPANLNLGLLYVLWGRYDQAIEYLQAALEQMPDNAGARNNLAVALIRLGRYEEARKELQQILDKTPDDPMPYFNMALSYAFERNIPEAMNWIRQGSSHCAPTVAQRYLADPDFDMLRGQAEFQEFIRGLYPDLPKAPES